MDKRGRQQLLLKLENKRRALDVELQEIRKGSSRRSQISNEWEPTGRLNQELDFIGEYLVEFAKFSLETAQAVSGERAAFELASEQIAELLDRFEPHVSVYAGILSRAHKRHSFDTQSAHAIDRLNRAKIRVTELLAEAEYDFLPGAGSVASNLSPGELDQWISQCGTSNSKEAWSLIKTQTRLPVPQLKFFRERWRIVTGFRGRGRPKKNIF